MTQTFSRGLTGLFAAALMAGCGGGDTDSRPSGGATSETSVVQASADGLTRSQTRFMRDMIKDHDCNPKIARAMAPYETDGGQCERMQKFEDTCGAQNLDAGIALIGDAQAIETGLNPWIWSCVRSQDTRTSLKAVCEYRFERKKGICDCVADGTMAAEPDTELLQWFATAMANDPSAGEGRYEPWMTMGSDDNRFDDLAKTKAVFFKVAEDCGL